MTTVIDALVSLVPGSENNWSVNGDLEDPNFSLSTNLMGITLPTKLQIEAKITELRLNQAKLLKKAEIDKWAHSTIGADIVYQIDGAAHGFQTNYTFPPPEDQREAITVLMLGHISLMSDAATVSWITRQNVTINLTKADMKNILTMFFERQTQVMLQARTYKEQLESLTTIQQVVGFEVG